MVLGKKFFVTPSDSVAVIAAYATRAIPYFKNGVHALARSMPTSAALDRVASKLNVPFYEVPTGWKFFGNIMDGFLAKGTPGVICGEESFGTGSDHIREKDGIWAVLAWLSILAYKNKDNAPGAPLISVADIVHEHWAEFGRNYYTRYDYEEVTTDQAKAVVNELHALQQQAGVIGKEFRTGYVLSITDEFEYNDSFDHSISKNQGIRFVFSNGARFVLRLSGTGSSGATIRLYAESYTTDPAKLQGDPKTELAEVIAIALELAKIKEHTGRNEPTVIT